MNAINLSVVGFAASQYRKKVKNGQCWHLAEEALKYAGAKTSSDIMGKKNITLTADYIWGAPISINNIEPGDILQFRNYRYIITNSLGNTFGSGRPHHTAIVAAVYPVIGAKAVLVYEQNAPQEGDPVTTTNLYLSSGMAALDWTSSVVISGQIWAYRPIK